MSTFTDHVKLKERRSYRSSPSAGSEAGMRASLAAIHYHATRPTCPTTIAMDALLYTIRDECERCLPQLKRVRPPNGPAQQRHEETPGPGSVQPDGSAIRCRMRGCRRLARWKSPFGNPFCEKHRAALERLYPPVTKWEPLPNKQLTHGAKTL